MLPEGRIAATNAEAIHERRVVRLASEGADRRYQVRQPLSIDAIKGVGIGPDQSARLLGSGVKSPEQLLEEIEQGC